MSAVVERLINLLAYLLDAKRPVTASEIRNDVAGYATSSDQAFRRKFERDKDSLRRLGISLELRATDVWEVEWGYVVPDENYRNIEPGFTDEERTALALAVHMVRTGGWPAGADALLKLGGARSVDPGRPILADLGLESDRLGLIFQAVLEQQRLCFRYRDRTRRIEPYGIYHRSGHWYFAGADPNDPGMPRTYRLDRAHGLRVEGPTGAFERPSGFSARDMLSSLPWEQGAQQRTARVRLDPDVAWWAENRFPGSQTVEVDADGSLVLDIPYAEPDSFIDVVLEVDGAAVILAPTDLRRRLIRRVENA